MGRRAAAGPPGPFPPLCPPTRPPPPREVRRMQYLKQFSYGLLLLFLFSPFLIACMGLRSMSVCVVGVPRRDRITRQWSRLGAFSSLCRPRLRGTPQPGRLGWEGWLLSPVLVGAGSRCCLAGALDLIPPPAPMLASCVGTGRGSGRIAGKELVCPPFARSRQLFRGVCAGLFTLVAWPCGRVFSMGKFVVESVGGSADPKTTFSTWVQSRSPCHMVL